MLSKYFKQGAAEPGGKPFWIDLMQPTAEEVAEVQRDFQIRVPTRDALTEIESSSRLRAEDQVLYLSMPLAALEEHGGLTPLPLGFILSPDLLITVRYSDVHAFADVRARVAREPWCMNGAGTFTALIEGMVDFSADVLENISSQLAGLSRHVFGPNEAPKGRAVPVSRALKQKLVVVGSAGDHLARIRESLLGLQRITGYVREMAAERLTPELISRLKTARQDLMSLVDFEAHLSSQTQFLLDAILGFINTEQNDIFKVLTIVSVVGIPPTLIASMYGMNFHNMPELNWQHGYAYGLGLIALSIIVPALWFKRRGWW